MLEKQSQKPTITLTLTQKLLNSPVLSPMPNSLLQKLKQSLQSSNAQLLFSRFLSKKLSEQDQVVIRLKCWVLLHLLISGQIEHETALLLEKVFQHFEEKTQKDKREDKSYDMDTYFKKEVEVPYITFLKKLNFWKMIEMSSLQSDPIDIGFSQLNKIKEILQLKKIFHNYSCYYPSHEYALNIFLACLHNIKEFWTSVCLKIKDVTIISLKNQLIAEKQFLLIKEAENVQDSLVQFVYGEKFALKLPKELKIRQINLLKTEVKNLQVEQKKKKSRKATLEGIEEKKRKASIKTLDTQGSDKTTQPFKTDHKQLFEDRLTTERQIQILDTINQLQTLLDCQK